MNYNKNCYFIEEVYFKNGMFDKSVDCTYILTMTNSKRIPHFMKQLHKFKPHSLIKIQYNKGFKNCKKKLLQQKTNIDLLDAVYNIFLDARAHNYNKILVFEDDFFFDETKFNSSDIKHINSFINNNTVDIYNLGPILHISNFHILNPRHMVSLWQTSIHSVIYSEKYRKKYIEFYSNNKIIDHADGKFFNRIEFKKFCYSKPICFQLFPDTENKQNWKFSNSNILNSIIKNTELDKSNKNYTKIFNLFSSLPPLIYFIILLLIVCLVVFLVKKYIKK